MTQYGFWRGKRAGIKRLARLVGVAGIVGMLTAIAHGQGVPLEAACMSPGDSPTLADGRDTCGEIASDEGFQVGVFKACLPLGGAHPNPNMVSLTFDCGEDLVPCPGQQRAWVCEGLGDAVAGGSSVEVAGASLCQICPQGYHCHCTPATGTCACYIKQPKPH